ncbi:MAG TPA: RHS repeat-associated core domain-containing protein [Acidothermaceae bacterium]|nr:RHS repeat-associated core domain-containing protein [Acidothermaceae bacterium]
MGNPRGRAQAWLVALVALALVALAGCKGGGHPAAAPDASATSGASTAKGPGALSTSVDNPKLDTCDDLGILPCARQVNRVLLPIAGSSLQLVYSSDRQPGRRADAAPAAAPVGLGGWSISDLPGYDPATKSEILPQGAVRKITGSSIGAAFAVVDPAGATATEFDKQGRAMTTVDAVTGATVATFTWTAAGLATVTDGSDATLKIGRDQAGNPTSLSVTGTSPMTLTSTSGELTGVFYPNGNNVQLSAGSNGLLTSITDWNGLTTTYTYDSGGRLGGRYDPTGALTRYTRTDATNTATVTTSNPSGTTTSDSVSLADGTTTYTHRDADGATSTVAANGATRTVTSSGATTKITLAADPRWGADLEQVASVAGGGSTLAVATTNTNGALSRKITVDGRTWTFGYDPASRTTTVTDPTGASRATAVDAHGQVASTSVDGVPVAYAYDALGRTTAITIGTGVQSRVWRYAYAPGSITVTDPVGDTTSETVDASGRVTAIAGPEHTGVTTTLDPAGRITSFAAPVGGSYAITWGANGAPLAVNAPAGSGVAQYTGMSYDKDGNLTARTTGAGSLGITYNAGRTAAVDTGNSTYSLAYDAQGRLTTATSKTSSISASYTGPWLSGVTEKITGPTNTVTAAVTRTTDASGRTTSLTVASGAPINYSYDAAGNVTAAGAITDTRDPATGWIVKRTLGSLTETLGYNQFGEPTSMVVTGPQGSVAAITEQRDGLGRVVTWHLVTASADTTTTYAYDPAGRVTSETTDGASTNYSYDAAGNITTIARPGTPTVHDTYDQRNALVTSGQTSYTYDAAGRLVSTKTPNGTTTYNYDAAGDLLSVAAPNSPALTYTVDAEGRRVARAESGATTGVVAYLDGLRPAAQLSPSGAVTAQYVYDGDVSPTAINDGGANLPAYLSKGGTDYLEVPDPSGGPALAINASDGSIADAVRRNALGSVLSESSPGFQIIGFGGGLTDPGTNLVQFGVRDYDPSTGRWTAPDPLAISGGSANLYLYASGDPVNRTDPLGTCDYSSFGISASGGAGYASGGVSFGVAWGGGQFGTYSTYSNGLGLDDSVSVGVTGSCLNSDNGDTSLGNFSGTGSSAEGTVDGLGGGSDKGYDGNGNQSSEGSHFTAGFGLGLGGSVQQSQTSIVCYFGCPSQVTVCGTMGCDSSPSKSAGDSSGGSVLPPSNGARSTGDPHLRTADNTHYDMQAVGEFTWATVPSGGSAAAPSGGFTVQVRQQPVHNSRRVALTTAVAAQVGGDRVTFAIPAHASDPPVFSVTGVPAGQDPPVGTFTLPHGATVVRTPQQVAISADGNTLWVGTNPYGLNVNASFSAAAQGQVRGLMGPSSGQPGNAVVTASGQKLTTDQLTNYDTLYRTFADSWRISQADSLFTDRPGNDATAFDDPTFPDPNPAPIPAADLTAAKAACSGYGFDPTDLADCEIDVASTGDAGFASALAASSGSVPGAAVGASVGTPAPGESTTAATTNSLRPGQTVSGTLPRGATKTYPFTVAAGTVGYFAAAPNCDASTSSNVLYTVAHVDGTSLTAGRYICDDVGRVVFADAGTYELLLRSPSGVGGTYSVTWKVSRADRVQALLAGQTATGTIDLPGARDIWTLGVPAGAVAYFSADKNCDQSTSSDLLYSVQGSDGSAFSAGRYICDDLGRVVFAKAGTYQLSVASEGGATRNYSVTWEISRADRALSLQPGQTASGTIDLPGAQDIWTFTVPAGTVAYFDADPNCSAAGGNLLYEVRDASGAPVSSGRYICDSLGKVAFPKAGTYRLVVSSVGPATKSYTILWKNS